MVKKTFLPFMVIAILVVAFGGLAVFNTAAAPIMVSAGWHAVPTPTVTLTPLTPAKVGSNAHLAISALVLVLIILAGVALNIRRKKSSPTLH